MLRRWIAASLCLGVALVPVAGHTGDGAPADIVLRGGTIVTVDGQRPQAGALAVRGEWIIAVGSDADVKPLIGRQTRVIELAGRLVIPRFIEGHGHSTSLREARLNLELTGARDCDEVVARVAERAKQTLPGEWIVGEGWHQGRWRWECWQTSSSCRRTS